ncbi:MAG: DUF1311 domain-containing protein [Flavobacteriales bacterium]|nr:DUF1311 domain-containing protein [Flavobacteriales bacterium]
MNYILYIALSLFPFFIFGQNEPKEKPWAIGCDTMHTQYDMNICSFSAYSIADSILTDLYNELENYYQTNLDNEKGIYDTFKRYQALFYERRDRDIELKKQEYSGGTIQAYMVNTYALELTINQIELLKEKLQEIQKK